MPRITPKEHYRRHIVLHGFWLSHDQLFGVLPPGKQWQLHRYYHPTASLTEAAFLTHRTTAAKAEPSLPHEAGKGFLELERHYKLALRLVEATGQDIDACLNAVIVKAPKTYSYVAAGAEDRPPSPSGCGNQDLQTALPRARPASQRLLRVVAVARPEPDVEKLAKILVEIVKRKNG